MTTSAHAHRPAPVGRPLVGFMVGKYFAMTANKTPDFNGITRNIEEAVRWSVELWRAGFLVFTPHLNTHHFEAKTVIDPNPLENEEYFRAFDRKLLMKGIDFIFATPNWRQSTGGLLEVQLACHLGIPVFEGMADLRTWADGGSLYSTVQYNEISEVAKHFGEGKDIPIVIVDGPYWKQNGVEPDVPGIRRYAHQAEESAIVLFNGKVGAFTPHLNASYERMGRIPMERYQLLCDQMLERVVDAVYLSPEWDMDEDSRRRLSLAHKLGKPAFSSLNELFAWHSGVSTYCTVALGP